MPIFLEITTRSSVALTYVNLDEVAVVELINDSATFHFRGDSTLKTKIYQLTPEAHEKLRKFFGVL